MANFWMDSKVGVVMGKIGCLVIANGVLACFGGWAFFIVGMIGSVIGLLVAAIYTS